ARGQRAHLAPAVSEELEWTRGRHLRIELPERSGRRVARIGEDGPAGLRLLLVEREERRARHVGLAAQLAYGRRSRTGEPLRHALHAPDVRRHVLPLDAVAARCGAHEQPTLVAQRE